MRGALAIMCPGMWRNWGNIVEMTMFIAWTVMDWGWAGFLEMGSLGPSAGCRLPATIGTIKLFRLSESF
jgi:hypothetical protein